MWEMWQEMEGRKEMRVKYPTRPVSRIRTLDRINYGCRLVMNDDTQFWFTLTEMNQIVRMWRSFKKQSGFKKI